MAFINESMSFTLHVGPPHANEYVKIGVEVNGINTELDLETQMLQAKESVRAIYEQILIPALDKMVEETIGATIVRSKN